MGCRERMRSRGTTEKNCSRIDSKNGACLLQTLGGRPRQNGLWFGRHPDYLIAVAEVLCRGAAEQSSPRHSANQPTCNLETPRPSQPRTVNHRRHPPDIEAPSSSTPLPSRNQPQRPRNIDYLPLQPPLQLALKPPTCPTSGKPLVGPGVLSSPQNTPSSPLPQQPTPKASCPEAHHYSVCATLV